MEFVFWLSFTALFVIYVGYGFLVWGFNKLKKNEDAFEGTEIARLPEVAILIAAYNEQGIIKTKIENTKALDYPTYKLKIYVVADGSNDATAQIVQNYDDVVLLNKADRKGKSAAINRAMGFIHEPITLLTDANVMLNQSALMAVVKHYANPKTGGVSGEKVVLDNRNAKAASTEGIYWKYESFLKQQDANLSSVIGAAGEVFSIRTALFEPLPEDTLLDDFMLSMAILRKGYAIQYEPSAMGIENPSSSISNEYLRKVRIAEGGIQSVFRNVDFCNPFQYGIISWQFIVHRVSRWFVAPFLLLVLLLSNFFLAFNSQIYTKLFLMHLLFHLLAFTGFLLSGHKTKTRFLSIPFYFDFMHYCVIVGWYRYLFGNTNVQWEKANRL